MQLAEDAREPAGGSGLPLIVRRFWWTVPLAIGCLAFSLHYSRLAPCGSWMNVIFQEEAWGEADPGSFYFASAHEFAWNEPALFIGHPGVPLVPLLYGVQAGLYHLHGDGDVSFTRFIAQHLPSAFLASKLMITLLHLLSFAAIYALSRQLLRDHAAAALATLGYATSLPVLYYLSRISVEPLMVFFFVTAFWASWRYEDLAREGRLGAALGWVGLAAAAAISGAMSKLAFVGPVPFLIALQILVGTGRSEPTGPIAWRARGWALGVYTAAGLLSLALYSQVMDWTRFARVWLPATQYAGDALDLSDFVPGIGATRIFLAAELGLLLFALVGWVLFLRRRSADRRRAFWLSAYGGYGLALFGYRVVLQGSFLPFHYSFALLATAAVFFGYAGVEAWRRWGLGGGWRAAFAVVLGLVLLHGAGAVAVVDAREHDRAEFEARRPAYALIAQLEPGDRLAVPAVQSRAEAVRHQLGLLHGFFFPVPWDPRDSLLREEFASFFVMTPPDRIPARARREFVPVLDADVSIVRVERNAPHRATFDRGGPAPDGERRREGRRLSR